MHVILSKSFCEVPDGKVQKKLTFEGFADNNEKAIKLILKRIGTIVYNSEGPLKAEAVLKDIAATVETLNFEGEKKHAILKKGDKYQVFEKKMIYTKGYFGSNYATEKVNKILTYFILETEYFPVTQKIIEEPSSPEVNNFRYIKNDKITEELKAAIFERRTRIN